MAWAYTITQAQTRPTILITHYDGHGIATAAALLRGGLQVNRIVCQYNRNPGAPQTGPEGIELILENLPPARLIVLDIPVNLKAPDRFIEAFRSYVARGGEVIYIDHHETSLPFIPRLLDAGVKAIYTGPGAYEMVVAAANILGVKYDEELAIIGAICDRSQDVIRLNKWSRDLQDYADALDVQIRNMSTGGSADYSVFIMQLAQLGKEAINRALCHQIPTVTQYELLNNVAIATQQLHPGWGPKSLERLAMATGRRYAVGVSYEQRSQGYVVRAIVLWTAKAVDPTLPSPGPVIAEYVKNRGYTIYGHPDAPTIGVLPTFEQAMQLAREIAQILDQVRYVPKVAHLISDESVARAVSADYAKILELLERIANALERGATAKERQVELLEGLYERDRRTRYD